LSGRTVTKETNVKDLSEMNLNDLLKEMANRAGESLKEIISASSKVVDDVNQVASASEEQSTTAEQISKNIETISNISNESASGIQLIAKFSEELNSLIGNLQELIQKFNIINYDNEKDTHYSIRRNGKLLKS
jgi:methyl-accepting chemotaxis protein